MCIRDRHWAEETPDKEYIVYSDRNLRFTWSQLNRRVDDMAKGLIAVSYTHLDVYKRQLLRWCEMLFAILKVH